MDDLLRFVFDSATEGMIFLDEGFRILEANEACGAIFGVSPAGLRGQAALSPGWKLYREDGELYGQEDHLSLRAWLRGGDPHPRIIGIKNAHSPGLLWLRVAARPRSLPGEAGTGFILATFEDVTEQRLAQAKLSRKIAFLDSMTDFALQLDGGTGEGLYDLIAESARIIFDAKVGALAGYRPETRELVTEAISWSESLESGVLKLIGKGIRGLAAPVSDDEYRIMMDLKVGVASTLGDFSFGKIPAGISEAIEKTLGIGWFRGLVLISEGRLFGGLGLAGAKGHAAPEIDELRVFAEITANGLRRSLAERRIESLLKEKEVLLHEVHHRIKNNMNTMVSLLSLQAMSCQDGGDAASVLKDAMSRLQSMSTLYDKLYRSQDLKSLSLAEYLPALAGEIIATFPGAEKVKLAVSADDVRIGANQLPIIGIIVNELLTNSMKYAFPVDGGGSIGITARKRKGRIFLCIEDDGVGFPPGVQADSPSSFGLGLVQTLADQLGAGLTIDGRQGVRFTLDFSAE
jgi:PAS domain S-box-containing protein